MRDLARLAAGVVALVVLLRNTAVAGPSQGIYGATVLVGVLVVASLTLWREGFVTGAGVGLAGHYLLALTFGDVVLDVFAPVVGALVVLYLDLADLALSVPADRRVDRALLRASARRAGAVLVAGTAAGTAAYALAAVDWPGLEVVRAAGALGVLAVVAIPVLLIRRAR